MSIIVALKDGDTVCLGTDSRFMNLDFTAISSDAVPKIYSIGSDGFIATGGFTPACDFQQTRAPELARELGTADIVAIADALARESLPVMCELLNTFNSIALSDPDRYEHLRQWTCGESELHTCALAGRNSQGDAGFVSLFFRAAAGGLICKKREHFGGGRGIVAAAGAASMQCLPTVVQDAMSLPPVSAVRFILRNSRSATVGGPDQIVIVDSNGARWVDHLPTQKALPRGVDCGQFPSRTLVGSEIPTRTITPAVIFATTTYEEPRRW
jgi:hypothetical protein